MDIDLSITQLLGSLRYEKTHEDEITVAVGYILTSRIYKTKYNYW